MAVTDIASRTYNHGWRLDPIVRSLLDTDFYKLLMLQMIREFYPDQHVTFSVINRTRHVRLAEIIDEGELRAQLDHARTIRFSKKEMIWLAGNTFYGKTQMFSPDFLNWLADFRLPEYELRKVDGQYELHFHGPWTHTTMWEIPALAIINELRSRAGDARDRAASRSTCSMPAPRPSCGPRSSGCASSKACGCPISARGAATAFCGSAGASRRVKEGLGPSFTGTSNVLLAMDNDLEAIGTNAHELPMVAAALANDDDELRWAPYRILEQWRAYLWRQPPDRAARRLRHQAVPARCAGLGRRLDRLSPRQRAADRRPARRSSNGGSRRAAIPGRSCWCFPTAWTSTRSRRPIGISPAGCA